MVEWQFSYKTQRKARYFSQFTFHTLFISSLNSVELFCEKCCAIFTTFSSENVTHSEELSSKTKGPGEQGSAGYCRKILLLNRAKMVSVPSIGVIGKSALEIGQFLRRNFWMISGGHFLSWPFVLLLKKGDRASDSAVALDRF